MSAFQRRAVKTTALVLSLALSAGCGTEVSAPDGVQPGAVQAHASTEEETKGGNHTEPMGFAACENGLAGPFPCKGVDLMSLVPTNELCAGGSGGDLWGWTDKRDGREYAVMSHGSSTSFVDVTEPSAPVLLGCLPAPDANFLWRDVEVFADHAYITGDAPPSGSDRHGVQIFDLRKLSEIPRPVITPHVLTETAHYDGGRIHTITINPEARTAYLAASEDCGRTLEIVDLSVPAAPRFLGCLRMSFMRDSVEVRVTTHEAHCVNYNGPDTRFHGREICFFANQDRLHVVDVTDKTLDAQGRWITGAKVLSIIDYEGRSYTHQGWLAHDQRYFLLGDELDEVDNAAAGQRTRTYIFDMAKLDSPVELGPYVHATTCIDHQILVRGPLMYQSNYTCGLRILDVRKVGTGEVTEVGYFDTMPADDLPSFSGAWGNYPYFKSGNVIVSDIGQGLFVLRPH